MPRDDSSRSRSVMNRFKIAFVGAPQAGKTSLMCAWYRLASQVYDAQPQPGDPETARFLDIYQRLDNDGVVDPTHRGDWARAKFNCRHRHHEFTLWLCDYSGEDVLGQVSEEFFSKDATAQAARKVVPRDIQEADWIVLVHDPAKLVRGSPEDQHDAMWIGRLLPQLRDRGRAGIITNTTIYLSRADIVDLANMAQARQMIEDVLPKRFRGDAAPTIVAGSSVVLNQTDADRVCLPDSEHGREVQQLFNSVMTNVIGRGQRRRRSFSWELLFLGVLMLLAAGAVGWKFWPAAVATNSPVEQELWTSHQSQLDEIRQRADRKLTYSEAGSRLKELDDWENRARDDFREPYENSNLQITVDQLRKRLQSVSEPGGIEAVQQGVAELHRLHGPNRRAFYEAVAERAETSVSDAGRYSNEARQEWQRVTEFCELILNGLTVHLGSSYMTTHAWWTTAGSADVRLEIWSVPKGDPRPFDDDTAEGATVVTSRTGPIKAADGGHTYRWSAGQPDGFRLNIDDRLWVRFFEFNYDDETLAFVEVPIGGADGLDWFGQVQTIRLHGKPATCHIRLQTGADVTVPESIRNAFAQ